MNQWLAQQNPWKNLIRNISNCCLIKYIEWFFSVSCILLNTSILGYQDTHKIHKKISFHRNNEGGMILTEHFNKEII